MNRVVLICLCIFVTSPIRALAANDERPSNLILIIGDGMGLSTIDTTSLLLKGPRGKLMMETMPVVGLVKTHSVGTLIPDSASTGTALATGHRTVIGAVGIDDAGRPRQTLMEAMMATGKRAGVVTTTYMVDATPAVFTAHAKSRKEYYEIGKQMFGLELDLYVGGQIGLHGDKDSADRKHIRTQLERMVAEKGYTYIREGDYPQDSTPKLIGLFPKRDKTDGFGPPLVDSTEYALRLLGNEGSGFMLLVESEETDNAGHQQDLEYLTAAVEELDQAVAAALSFAKKRGDTLVLVTADHVTGGVGVIAGESTTKGFKTAWHSTGHTGQWVPLFAYGPGAERFSGVYDSIDIPRFLGELFGLKGFPESD